MSLITPADWSATARPVQAESAGRVRLDCHAGNPWLCRYYEAHGFALRGRIEPHPGYDRCLYQLATAAIVGSPDPDN